MQFSSSVLSRMYINSSVFGLDIDIGAFHIEGPFILTIRLDPTMKWINRSGHTRFAAPISPP